MTFPDCMMPDGAAPCTGFRVLEQRMMMLKAMCDSALSERDEARLIAERWRGRWAMVNERVNPADPFSGDNVLPWEGEPSDER